MELLTILWLSILFLVGLLLLFVWSKIVIVNKRINNISLLLEKCKKIREGEEEE